MAKKLAQDYAVWASIDPDAYDTKTEFLNIRNEVALNVKTILGFENDPRQIGHYAGFPQSHAEYIKAHVERIAKSKTPIVCVITVDTDNMDDLYTEEEISLCLQQMHDLRYAVSLGIPIIFTDCDTQSDAEMIFIKPSDTLEYDVRDQAVNIHGQTPRVIYRKHPNAYVDAEPNQALHFSFTACNQEEGVQKVSEVLVAWNNDSVKFTATYQKWYKDVVSAEINVPPDNFDEILPVPFEEQSLGYAEVACTTQTYVSSVHRRLLPYRK